MGLTSVGDETFILTWRSHKILKFQLDDLLSGFASPNIKPEKIDLPSPLIQAWGLASDSLGKLYVTDGSNYISVINSKT